MEILEYSLPEDLLFMLFGMNKRAPLCPMKNMHRIRPGLSGESVLMFLQQAPHPPGHPLLDRTGHFP